MLWDFINSTLHIWIASLWCDTCGRSDTHQGKGEESSWNQFHQEILQVVNWNQDKLRKNNYMLLTVNEISICNKELIITWLHFSVEDTCLNQDWVEQHQHLFKQKTRDKWRGRTIGQSFTHRVGLLCLSSRNSPTNVTSGRDKKHKQDEGRRGAAGAQPTACRQALGVQNSSSWRDL